MLTAYIQAALKRTRCKWLPDDKTFYCEIPDLPGVWASGATDSAARTELEDVLEDWIALWLTFRQPLPILDGFVIGSAPTT